MNKKRTNRLVAIFNFISIILYFIFKFSFSYLIDENWGGSGSIYRNSFVIEIINNYEFIVLLMFGVIGIINIICAIQNKQNKKIFFWQLIFGIFCLWIGVLLIDEILSGLNIDEDIFECITIIIFFIIPIILAMINLVLIKKNKPKVIQIISYIAVIISSILILLKSFSYYIYVELVIIVIMQLIYIHFQDKNIEESKSRKIVNMILYYIFPLIFFIGVFGILVYSLLITKVNETKGKNELTKLYNSIPSMKGVTIEDIYIPVEENDKYGFINKNGQEKIPCEYDSVTFFYEIEFNNNKYYVTLAKKDTKYYILSKSNDVLTIDGDLEKYLERMCGDWYEANNEDGDYVVDKIDCFDDLFIYCFRNQENIELNRQTLECNSEQNQISLIEKKSKYYYDSKNYSMKIEPIYDDLDEYEDLSSYETKYKVTISKDNEETQSSIVYLPGIKEASATLETYIDGSIAFKTENKKENGWYDLNGNQNLITNDYEIINIIDNKIILQESNIDEDENYDENEEYKNNFIIIDETDEILLQTTVLEIYDNIYLVKNDYNKMVLLDEDLNEMSNEYDKIIATSKYY